MADLGLQKISIGEAQKQFYQEQGYLLIENVLPKVLTDSLVKEADSITDDYAAKLDVHKKSDLFFSLLKEEHILAAADELLGARMIPIGSIFFYCKPGNVLDNGAVMHQDNYAPKAPYGAYLVTALALDDCNKENGSLIVVPKSHKLRDLESKPAVNFEYSADGSVAKTYAFGSAVKEIPQGYDQVQLEYPKGSLIFMHAHTVHGTEKNPSTRWRRKIYMHSIKEGNPFWPGWNAKRQLIERDV